MYTVEKRRVRPIAQSLTASGLRSRHHHLPRPPATFPQPSQASGWHCRYHGHVLVTGEAPEDLRQIFKQRSRWCTGCFQVFFQVETFMWVRQLPAIQMLCYFNSIMG